MIGIRADRNNEENVKKTNTTSAYLALSALNFDDHKSLDSCDVSPCFVLCFKDGTG
jgi:hypothetical protein